MNKFFVFSFCMWFLGMIMAPYCEHAREKVFSASVMIFSIIGMCVSLGLL
jgi:hypothetical protein